MSTECLIKKRKFWCFITPWHNDWQKAKAGRNMDTKKFQVKDFSVKSHRWQSGDCSSTLAPTLTSCHIFQWSLKLFDLPFLISKIEIVSWDLMLSLIFQYKKSQFGLKWTRSHRKDKICLKLFLTFMVS
jgi:hypothetical protein